jgi:hypothetical protein
MIDTGVPHRTMLIVQDLSSEEETELLSFLDKNNGIFAWATSNLIGVSRSIVEHKLYINPSAKKKAPQNVRRKSRNGKGEDPTAAGSGLYQRG